jgi:hypothetical protein
MTTYKIRVHLITITALIRSYSCDGTRSIQKTQNWARKGISFKQDSMTWPTPRTGWSQATVVGCIPRSCSLPLIREYCALSSQRSCCNQVRLVLCRNPSDDPPRALDVLTALIPELFFEICILLGNPLTIAPTEHLTRFPPTATRPDTRYQ